MIFILKMKNQCHGAGNVLNKNPGDTERIILKNVEKEIKNGV